MKNRSMSSMTPAIAALGAIALLLSMVLRDTATTEAATKQQTERASSVAETSARGSDAVKYVSGAYADGYLQGFGGPVNSKAASGTK
jgi:hypothetical protein